LCRKAACEDIPENVVRICSALDVIRIEVLGLGEKVRNLVFFVVALKTRAVEIAGIGANPGGEWM
jgi:hypothetical protein